MRSPLKRAYDPDDFRRQGHELVDLLADYLCDVSAPDRSLPVLPQRDPEEMFRKYSAMLEEPQGLSIAQFFSEVLADSNHIHHPGYVGHQVCPPAPLGALAGLAAGLLNNGSAVFEMGPANVAMERAVLQVLAGAIGFPAGADGVLTSGGSLGNLTALLAARASKNDPADRRPIAFLVSEASHYSNPKALRIMGLGPDSIIPVAVDDLCRIWESDLSPALKRAEGNGVRAIGLIANACTTGTGSYDDLEAASRFCRANGLWLHVDGAHGAAPVFSRRYRNLVQGIEAADSVVVDFHKLLLAPALATGVLFREGRNSYLAFSEKASYLWNRDEERQWFDFAKRTVECTKLMMGLKTFVLLKAFGPELFGEYIDRVHDLAREFAAMIRKRDRLELAQDPQSNIVCFRVVDSGCSPEGLDQINARIRRRVLGRGDFYVVQVQLGRGLFLRTALMNPLTTKGDLSRLLDQVEEAILESARGPGSRKGSSG